MADFFVFKLTEIWNPKPFRPAAAGDFRGLKASAETFRKNAESFEKKCRNTWQPPLQGGIFAVLGVIVFTTEDTDDPL